MPTPEYSSLFVCPQTGERLRQATDEEMEALKASGEQGLDGAWIRADSAVAYPVKKGIPLLVPAAAIQFKKTPPSRKENLSHD